MLLSILIPTLEERRAQFDTVHHTLRNQVSEAGLDGDVEILHLRDDGALTTGAKRNRLVRAARGEYVASVDDDDAVSPRYVRTLVTTLRENRGVDCVGITGEITYRGKHPRRFVCSLQNDEYRVVDNVFLMPAKHLNPIRRDIARRYEFEDVRVSEDSDWAMRMRADGALSSEVFLDDVLYFYRCRRPWAYQLFVERTEKLRHPLGLQVRNRLKVKRWLKAKLPVLRRSA